MKATPRHLRKPDVEALLAAVQGPTASAIEEATVLRVALEPALARVVGAAPGAAWAELVAAAAELGRWPVDRSGLVGAAGRPDLAADPEAVVEALWDLVTELNECRTILPPGR